MSEKFDAIVIGGGVIGASVLFQLAKLGCRKALLLERGEIAGGMTAYSSGIVRTHYSVATNVEVARASLGMFERFGELLDDPEADAGLVVSGYLIVAPPGASSDAVRGSIAMQRSLGVEAALLDKKAALGHHPWLNLDGIDAIGFESEAGFADPYLVTTGFIRAARRLGATVRTNTAVTGFLREGSRITGVQTSQGPIEAGVVLSAVNVWSRMVASWAGLDVPCDITAHHVFTLATDKLYTPNLPVLKDLASQARLYMRPTGGNLLVGGGYEGNEVADPDASDLEADQAAMLDEATQAAVRLPAFADGRFVRSWSGLYDTTPDWNPVLGPVPGIEGLQVAFGFSGHGFKMSPMIGRMLAQAMLGLETDFPIHPYRLTRYIEGQPLTGAYGAGAVS
jgi:glycine/D-amino acid oxidase-like deaminating enzyme